MFNYIEKFYKLSMRKRPGFIPINHNVSEEKLIDFLNVSEFIALYTYKIDEKWSNNKDIVLNDFGMKLYIDYIKSFEGNWVTRYYKIIDTIDDIINNKTLYMRYRKIFLNVINIYLHKFGNIIKFNEM